MINEDYFNQKLVHYKSKSGSLYFYTDKGVYRYSNHWGRVANCRWKISGIEAYKNQDYYTGYANWLDFHSLKSNEKCFYLEVNFEEASVKIYSIKEQNNPAEFLMTLEFALKRLKEIKTLFKEYKWALYFNENIDILRKELISLLINSDKPLQEIKLSFGKRFN
tara:strand:+ start:10533 stop:11024 length:492 start_codon:yes stop_codon:yes gene_type:complete